MFDLKMFKDSRAATIFPSEQLHLHDLEMKA
jgi:hypothetical protein